MKRGLPFSVVLHVGALVALLVFGARVSSPTVPKERVIRVHLTELPQPQTTTPEVAVIEPEQPTVEPEPAPPVVEAPPEMEPKQVPEKPREEPREEPKPPPEPKPQAEPREVQVDPPVDSVTPPAPTGPTASVTEVDFPFAYYLNIVEGRITRHWQPRQLGFRDTATRACVVQFVIARNGHIARVTLASSSGIALFDREAMGAVKAASPLPPLPGKFAGRELPVSMIFTLEPAH